MGSSVVEFSHARNYEEDLKQKIFTIVRTHLSSVYLMTMAQCTFLLPKIQKRNSLMLASFLSKYFISKWSFPTFQVPEALHAFVLLEWSQMLSFPFVQKTATIHIPIQLQGGVNPRCLCTVSEMTSDKL